MAVEIRGHGQTVRISERTWDISVPTEPKYKTKIVTGLINTDLPDYGGDYEVTPSTGEQELQTRNKTMRDDVTVHAIPYHETTNDAGGYTVSIAS